MNTTIFGTRFILRTFDCGYCVALVVGKSAETAFVRRWRSPVPLTLKSWRYLLKNRGTK